MIALRYMVLCFGILAAVLKSTHALSDEEKAKIKEVLMPAFFECGKQYNTDKEAIKAAKAKGELDSIDKCFFACIFKKNGFMTETGLFDVNGSLAKLYGYIEREEDQKKVADIANTCAEVNTKDVSDGEDGCERAKLLFSCFNEHKDKFNLN